MEYKAFLQSALDHGLLLEFAQPLLALQVRRAAPVQVVRFVRFDQVLDLSAG
jgi:hypothetical protein